MLDLDYKEVAEKYGGNKQKIAQAAALGALGPEGPLLAVTAGMYIDRMRAAQMQEQAPQQTVAEQVLAPPAPVPPQMPQGGLGAPGMAPPLPQGAPPMGAPPAPAPAQPPMGMAEGGFLPPYASGGLTDLPLPDGMFDEPGNGGFSDGYAGGGLVAFASAGPVEEEEEYSGEIVVNAPRKPKSLGPISMFDLPESIFGFNSDAFTNIDLIKELAPQETKQSKRLSEYYEKSLDPAEQAKRKKEDMWMTLGQIGARMAQTPGSFLQAASAGIGEALPGAREANKERRTEQRDAIKMLAAQEAQTNKGRSEMANAAIAMQEKYGTLALALQDNAFKDKWAKMDDATKRFLGQIDASTRMALGRMSKEATLGAAGMGLQRLLLGASSKVAAAVDEQLFMNPTVTGPDGKPVKYRALLKADPAAAANVRRSMIRGGVNDYLSGFAGGEEMAGDVGGSDDPLGLRQ